MVLRKVGLKSEVPVQTVQDCKREDAMRTSRRYFIVALATVMLLSLGSARTADLSPASRIYRRPDQIAWKTNPTSGAQTAILLGDPSKPGLYIELLKRPPNDWSKAHWHPNDRFLTVLSGTFWVGTGSKVDPASTVPMPAGSVGTDFAKGVHFDGTKDDGVVLEIVGEGPATSIPADEK
jgi:hypothetical protein